MTSLFALPLLALAGAQQSPPETARPPRPVYAPPVLAPYPAVPRPPPPPPPRWPYARPPVHRSGSIMDRDYPAAAIRAEEEGSVMAMMTVGTDGRVRHCRVVRSSGSTLLDSTTCALATQRFIFDPALDERGRPVAGIATRTVRWQLPERRPQPFAPTQIVTRIAASTGTIAGCSVTTNGVLSAESTSDSCALDLFPSIAAWLIGQQRNDTVTVVSQFLPDGSAPPASAANWGDLISEGEAQLTVAPDGRVASCRQTIRRQTVPLPMLAIHDMCGNSGHPANRFTSVGAGEGPRRATLSVSIYLRRSAGR